MKEQQSELDFLKSELKEIKTQLKKNK